MKRTDKGYAFPVVTDLNSEVGIKEEYKAIVSGDTVRVNAIFGLGVDFQPVKPATLKDSCFTSVESYILDSQVNKQDAMTMFMCSNKAVYSVLSSCFLVCKLFGRYDFAKEVWLEGSNVLLYSPVGVGQDSTSKYLICNELSDTAGVKMTVVDGKLLEQIRKKVFDYMIDGLIDRETFIALRSNLL